MVGAGRRRRGDFGYPQWPARHRPGRRPRRGPAGWRRAPRPLPAPRRAREPPHRVDAPPPGRGRLERREPRAADRARPSVLRRAARAGQRAWGRATSSSSSTGAGDPDQRLTDDPGSTVSATFTAAARRGRRRARAAVALALEQARLPLREVAAARHRDRRGRRPVPARHAGAHRRLPTTRSSSCCATGTTRRATSPTSAASTCATAAATRSSTRATARPSRCRRRSAGGPRGTTCTSPSTGPAVFDVETTFRERWEDSTPLTLNPGRLRVEPERGARTSRRDPCAEQAPPPPSPARRAPRPCRSCAPTRRSCPRATTSPRRGAQRRARQHQGRAPRPAPGLPRGPVPLERGGRPALRRGAARQPRAAPRRGHPDAAGRWTARSPCPPQLYGRRLAMDLLLEAGGDRVAVYGLTSEAGYPIYVHAKVCVIDDVWASVGSDNFNRRSWSSDSEIACAVQDTRVEGRDGPAPRDAVRAAVAARAASASTSVSTPTTCPTTTRPSGTSWRRRPPRSTSGMPPAAVPGGVATCPVPRRPSRARASGGAAGRGRGRGPPAWSARPGGCAGSTRPR